MCDAEYIGKVLSGNSANSDSVQETARTVKDFVRRKGGKAIDYVFETDRVLALVADVFSMYSTSSDELTEDAAFGMHLLLQNWRKRGMEIVND